ncbi:MAG: hypothetical protein DMF06_03460 [Verrucomicrobia bacterium]|nr:MAG: hypothetical protein DMF06_03460 [Verrucomicrobiota bacterium]
MSGTYVTTSQYNQVIGNVKPMYMDTCKRLVYTAPSDQGYGKPTYPAGASLACLFDGRPDFDAMAGTAVPQVDATLYLPRDSVLLPDDRVQVTHIHGLAILSPLTYEIVAGPTVDYMTMVAKLRLVTE